MDDPFRISPRAQAVIDFAETLDIPDKWHRYRLHEFKAKELSSRRWQAIRLILTFASAAAAWYTRETWWLVTPLAGVSFYLMAKGFEENGRAQGFGDGLQAGYASRVFGEARIEPEDIGNFWTQYGRANDEQRLDDLYDRLVARKSTQNNSALTKVQPAVQEGLEDDEG